MVEKKNLYFDLEFSGCLRLITFRYNRFGLVYVTNVTNGRECVSFLKINQSDPLAFLSRDFFSPMNSTWHLAGICVCDATETFSLFTKPESD